MLYVLLPHHWDLVRDGELDGGAAGLGGSVTCVVIRAGSLDAPAFEPGLVGQSFTVGSWFAHLPPRGARRPLPTGRSGLLR